MRTCFLARTPKRVCVFISILVFLLNAMLCWGCVFFVFFVLFCVFSAQENTWNKNACVCCFQNKGSSKNSYVYSFRTKETHMCFGVWTPQEKMYMCVLPQSFKGRKEWFSATSNSQEGALHALSDASLLQPFPRHMATPEETLVQCLLWMHPIRNFSLHRACQAEKGSEIARI